MAPFFLGKNMNSVQEMDHITTYDDHGRSLEAYATISRYFEGNISANYEKVQEYLNSRRIPEPDNDRGSFIVVFN